MALADSIAQLLADVNVAHQIVQGPASGTGSTVTTDNGSVKTLAKISGDADTTIQSAVAGITSDVQAADAAKQGAATSESTAQIAAGSALSDATVATTQATLSSQQTSAAITATAKAIRKANESAALAAQTADNVSKASSAAAQSLNYLGMVTGQTLLALQYSTMASSVVQPDVSGSTNAILHRSPNAVTAMFLYDTALDTDGGAWTQRCGNLSWFNETLFGNWLTTTSSAGFDTELMARATGGSLGPELLTATLFSPSGWSTVGANVTIANGAISVTASPGASGTTIVSQNGNLTVGKMYAMTYTITAINGQLSANYYGGNATIRSAPGTYVDIGAAVGSSTQLIVRGTGLTTATITNVSIKEVTAINTQNNDYFQCATDGKFYRLSKNWLSGSIFFGSGGPGTFPATWGNTGSPGTSTSVAQETVNGINTGVVKIRRVQNLVNAEGTQVNRPIPAGTYGVRVLVRVPTGLTTTDLAIYDGASPVTIVNATTLAAQPKDVWVEYKTTYTTPVSRTLFSFCAVGANGSPGAIGSGFDIAMPQLELNSYSSYDATSTTAVVAGDEVFRGNAQRFPRMAAIVADVNRTVIYDLTQSGCPMWMVFRTDFGGGMIRTALATGSLTMLNGELVIGVNSVSGDINRINFIKDNCSTTSTNTIQTFNGGISARNTGLGYTVYTTGTYLPHRQVLGVAQSVQKNAPIDPTTGLHVPTLAVATGTGTTGGVAVFRHDGTCVQLTNTNNSYTVARRVWFDKKGRLGFNFSFQGIADDLIIHFVDVPTTSVSVSSPGVPFTTLNGEVYRYQTNAGSTIPAALLPNAQNSFVVNYAQSGEYGTHNTGVTLFKRNTGTQASGMVAYIHGAYNTGWVVGDTRRCLAVECVSGTTTNNERITNGTFTTDLSNWTDFSTAPATVAWSSGSVLFTRTDTNNARLDQAITTVIGRTYQIVCDIGTNTLQVQVGATSGQQDVLSLTNMTVGVGKVAQFTASSTTSFVRFTTTVVGTATLDNVSVKEVVGDRAYKFTGSRANGSLTYSAVGVGSQMMGLSGFTNDLNQTTELVINGDFSVGTGWTLTNGAVISGGILSLPTVSSSTAEQMITTVAGRSYVVTATIGGAGAYCGAWDNSGQSGVLKDLSGNNSSAGRLGTVSFVFVASDTTSYLVFGATASGAGTVDNVSVKPYNATGSAANVAQEVLSSSDLDFGTAVWSGSGWFNVPSGSYGPANFVTNSSMTGAVNGVIGSGGAMPTGMSAFGAGLTYTVSNAGTTSSGMPRITVRVQGTTTDANGIRIALFAQSFNAVVGDKVYAQAQVALTSGTLTNVNSQQLLSDIADSGGAYSSTLVHVNALTLNAGLTLNGGGATISASNANRIPKTYFYFSTFSGVSIDFTLDIVAPQVNRGLTASVYNPTSGTVFNGIAPIFDRSGPNGAYLRMGVDGNGSVAAEVFDGTTTRRVTSANAFNSGSWSRAQVDYATNGTLTLKTNADQVATTTGSALLTLNNSLALLTVGNNYQLNAAFPGSLALVKLGVTVPSSDQVPLIFGQERELFYDGSQVTMPDYTGAVNSSYDDLQDKLVAVSASNESTFTGIVRTSTTPVPAGAYILTSARSGFKLSARSTAIPGVEVTVPSSNIRAELLRRAEHASRISRMQTVFDYDATTGQTDFVLPVGYVLVDAYIAGGGKREGSTKDWIRVDDGFKETARFNSAPGAGVWIQLDARRYV